MSEQTNSLPSNYLLKVRESAQRLRLSERKVWELIAAKHLAHVRLGRSVRILLSDLDAYIKEHRIGG